MCSSWYGRRRRSSFDFASHGEALGSMHAHFRACTLACTPITPITPLSCSLPYALPYALCLVHSFAFHCRRTHAACIQASRACVHTSMGIRMQACMHAWAGMRKIWNASRICVSSLRRGHANLLCIVPILVYVSPERTRYSIRIVKILMQEPSLKTLTCGTPSLAKGRQGLRASVRFRTLTTS